MRPSRMNRNRAFTLIELLVVIAIIAILAAILFPVFAQAKAAGKQTQCASNVRGLSQAMVLYMTDYDDRFCLAAYFDEGGTHLWHDLLDPYVKNKQVWLCPGCALKDRDETGAPTSHFGYNVGYLTDFAQDFSNAASSTAVGLSSVGSPSDTVLFTSARTSIYPESSWCGDDGKLLLPPSWPSGDCWGRPDPVHFNKATIAWTDTHVTKRALSGFYTGQDPQDRWFDLE